MKRSEASRSSSKVLPRFCISWILFIASVLLWVESIASCYVAKRSTHDATEIPLTGKIVTDWLPNNVKKDHTLCGTFRATSTCHRKRMIPSGMIWLDPVKDTYLSYGALQK